MTAKVDTPGYTLPPPFDHVPVRVGPPDVDPASLTQLSELSWANDNTVVFRSERITLAVHGTETVSIDVARGTHHDLVEALLYGYAMRVLLLHAGVFSLHGSLVRTTNGTSARNIAIAGHSGAGKSTTVSYLASAHGASVAIDDVLPLTVSDGVVTAHPFMRPVHLLPDAAARLGLDASDVSDNPTEGIGKLVADIAAPAGPVVVDELVILTLADPTAPEPLTITPVTGAERLRYVVRVSNSTGVMSFGSRADTYLAWAMQVASAITVTQIVRRPDADTLDDVARYITGS